MNILQHHLSVSVLRRLAFIIALLVFSLVLAAERPMQVGAVALAQQTSFDSFKSQLTDAVDTRLDESKEVDEIVASADYLPADVKKNITADNKSNTAALNTIKGSLANAKSTDDLQKTAQQLDGQYTQSQFNVQQGAIAQDLNTQQDAASQLQSMVDQAKSLMQQCMDNAAKAGGGTDGQSGANTQNCTNVSSSTGNSGGGSSSIDVQALIEKIVKILAIVAAIIASITALILAIQDGNYTEAATLFVTIIGELESVATMLLDGESQMSEAVDGLGGSSSGGSNGGSKGSSGNSGNGTGGNGSNNGGSNGNVSDSASLLPVGDGKYSSSGAKKGYVYTCSQYAQTFSQGKGGATTRGPWFVNNNSQYDPDKKPHVQGSVRWNGTFNNSITGDKRTIKTNAVPGSHTTGNFPISSSDPAHNYDANPNRIQTHSFTYELPSNPTPGTPQCMGHEAGIMLSGVSIFGALDERGRDAGAWETQDSCEGHPQGTSIYHYHTLSNCIGAVDTRTVIGFALDGFPITGPKNDAGKLLVTNDLDECHGTTSEITLDGRKTTMYHYVMTKDFPYSVGCFRSKPIAPPTR